jgi:hypothetical protein
VACSEKNNNTLVKGAGIVNVYQCLTTVHPLQKCSYANPKQIRIMSLTEGNLGKLVLDIGQANKILF